MYVWSNEISIQCEDAVLRAAIIPFLTPQKEKWKVSFPHFASDAASRINVAKGLIAADRRLCHEGLVC